ncbi:MAG: NADH-quinone oxidoreductase subunit N [Bacteroidia bacterium]|nr:NADH-quinone oxidoreductase subunit N [Bacteroidia bacterium]
MNLHSFLLMRHELMLTGIALLILFIEIFFNEKRNHAIIPICISLFFINTVIGFLLPSHSGTLFGGMYKTGELQILMKNVLNVGVLIVLIQSVKWLKSVENIGKTNEFFIILFSALIGMNFMISSGDFLMFYLGLELATIPMAALAAYERSKNKSAEAGVKLILSAALSSGIMLYGVSMIYGMTGSIYFDDISTAFTGSYGLNALALIFFFAGMAFKISLVPFHLWTADVYEGAPINITSFLSVISKGAAVFILSIILFNVFRSVIVMWQDLIYITAAITMTVGNLFAIRQTNIKRFLAFSSIAQAGFILLGMISGNQIGMTAIIYFVLIYIFSNLGAFGVATAISNATGKETIPEYNGLYKTNPKLSLTMMLSLFSLAGIPPVAGFFGKFFLFTAAASQGFYWLVFIAVVNATISLYYYLLVVKAMFINHNDEPIAYFKSDFYTRLGLLICLVGMFVIGFASNIYEFIFHVVSKI